MLKVPVQNPVRLLPEVRFFLYKTPQWISNKTIKMIDVSEGGHKGLKKTNKQTKKQIKIHQSKSKKNK